MLSYYFKLLSIVFVSLIIIGCNTTPDEGTGVENNDTIKETVTPIDEVADNEFLKFTQSFSVDKDLVSVPTIPGVQSVVDYFVFLNTKDNGGKGIRFEMKLTSATTGNSIVAKFPTPDGSTIDYAFDLNIVKENNDSVVVIAQQDTNNSNVYRMKYIGSNLDRTYLEFNVTQNYNGNSSDAFPAYWFKDKNFETFLYQKLTGDYSVPSTGGGTTETPDDSDPEISGSTTFTKPMLSNKRFFVLDVDKQEFDYKFNGSVTEAILTANTIAGVRQFTGKPTISAAGILGVESDELGQFEISIVENYGSCRVVNFKQLSNGDESEQIWFISNDDYKSAFNRSMESAKEFCATL
jgi:hypothetical protein